MALATRGISTKRMVLRNFSGGLNVRDALAELAPTESPDCMDVTLDERGGVTKRLGYTTSNGGTPPAALISQSYFSELIGKTIWQAGDKLYTQATPASNFSAAAHTFTTTARCAIVDFVGYVYAVHPVDGVIRSADGTTWSAVVAGPDGRAIAVYQNKLWICDDDGVTLYFSDAGDGTTWSGGGAGTVDIRAVNDAPLTACIVGAREGLLVFKEESAYRVYDSTTGAYQVLDPAVGAGGVNACINRYGFTYHACQHGIFRTDGLSQPVSLSERLKPLFSPGFLALAQLSGWAMGWKRDRIYLSLATNGESANDLVFEIHPELGWIVPHTCAASCYSTYGADDETLLGGSPATNGQALVLYDDTGTDAGTTIAARWWSRPFEPDGLTLKSFTKLGLNGRGNPYLYVRLAHDSFDQEAPGDLYQPDMRGSVAYTALTWDNSQNWDDSNYWADDVADFESYAELYGLGLGRAIQLGFTDTLTGTDTTKAYLDLGYSQTVGPWAIYELQLDHVPLGLA